jgi:hypothetical protein
MLPNFRQVGNRRYTYLEHLLDFEEESVRSLLSLPSPASNRRNRHEVGKEKEQSHLQIKRIANVSFLSFYPALDDEI